MYPYKHRIESHKSHVCEFVDGRKVPTITVTYHAEAVHAESGLRTFLGCSRDRKAAKSLCDAHKAAYLSCLREKLAREHVHE